MHSIAWRSFTRIKLQQIRKSSNSLEHTQSWDGTVMERLGDRLLVKLDQHEEPLNCRQHGKLRSVRLVPGDMVTCINSVGEWFVINGKERKNLLEQPMGNKPEKKVVMKSVASNIDHLCIITAVVPYTPLQSIDRYIVAAVNYNIPELSIAVNKMDLPESSELFHEMKRIYGGLNLNVLPVSAESGEGMEQLRELMRNKTSMFVGQSGIGKSSLMTYFLSREQGIKVGDLVGKSQTGSHTTSTAKLYEIPNKGKLIDTPGIRELAVWHLSAKDIEYGYTEIAAAAKGCKFSNCKHREKDEPHCGVRRALQEGAIDRSRYESFCYTVEQSVVRR